MQPVRVRFSIIRKSAVTTDNYISAKSYMEVSENEIRQYIM